MVSQNTETTQHKTTAGCPNPQALHDIQDNGLGLNNKKTTQDKSTSKLSKHLL